LFEDRDAYVVMLTVTDRAGNRGSDTMNITFTAQEVRGEFPWWIALLLLIIIIVLLLALLLLRRKKDEESEETEE